MSQRPGCLRLASSRIVGLAGFVGFLGIANIHCGDARSTAIDSTREGASGILWSGPIHPQASPSLCLDVVGQGTANGTEVQVWTCSGNANQQWSYDGASLRVYGTKCLDVPSGSTTNGTKLQIWDCSTGNANQAWTASGTSLQWTGRNECLDLTDGVAASGTILQDWSCYAGDVNQEWQFPSSLGTGGSSSGGGSGSSGGSGSGSSSGGSSSGGGVTSCPPSWTTTPQCGGSSTPPGPAPDFGANVIVLSPTTSNIQSQLDSIYSKMDSDQFDAKGYVYLFKPGQYNLDVQVGFYTHVIGLGKSPDDVSITGAVRAKADWLSPNNATCNFWRTVENLAVTPTQAIDNGTDVWATSQGTSIRRTHVKGSIVLSDNNGWASGGFIADSKIDAQINSATQQQYLARNDDLTKWQGGSWNMVFVGDKQAPSASWPYPPYTEIAATPVIREKPFLYVDGSGNYLVMVPALRQNATGSSWGSDAAGNPTPPGSPLSIDRFFVAKPTDSVTTINAALAQGKHLVLTPGDYKLASPIQVTKANTVVLGIGFPVLTSTSGNAVLTVADVDGVSLAGLLLEAGATSAATLLQVGDLGSTSDHSKAPTALFDVNCRVGGYIPGKAKVCVTINSNDVLVDNSWLWRADHGAGSDNGDSASWSTNQSNSGIVVNGNDVTAYGLFSEHHQQYQTLWNGNGGRVYFYQSELPYDPTSQSAWMASSSEDGYPSYKVASNVTTHTGEGIGIYSFFHNGSIHASNAVETPSGSGIVMHHLMTYGSGTGGIYNIINNSGGGGGSGTTYTSY